MAHEEGFDESYEKVQEKAFQAKGSNHLQLENEGSWSYGRGKFNGCGRGDARGRGGQALIYG